MPHNVGQPSVVSIHALTRSATFDFYGSENDFRFQSTHSRGVRRRSHQTSLMLLYSFNPRTHEECDEVEVTGTEERLRFNPRTHEECDNNSEQYLKGIESFNPRTHEECDRYAMRDTSIETMFQSTHSRGVRQDCCCGTQKEILFQSTHSRGVRHIYPSVLITGSSGFNPRTHEECDLRKALIRQPLPCFNPRTHEECDRIYFFFFIFRYLEQGFREFF